MNNRAGKRSMQCLKHFTFVAQNVGVPVSLAAMEMGITGSFPLQNGFSIT